ncbi:MAG: dihydroorotase [bacterium]
MSQKFDLLLKNATVVNHDGAGKRNIGVRNGKIAAIGALEGASAEEEINCRGLHILPGFIDSQVHFREPGNEHKEDLESGSRAAIMGGVTSVFEMPNTNPLTTTAAAIEDKLNRAKNRMWCDHAFYVGATHDNAQDLVELEMLPGVCGVKIFMGASTGNLLVADDDGVRTILSHGRRRVAVHSEDEEMLRAEAGLARPGDWTSHPEARSWQAALRCTERLIAIARETGRLIHVLHISTAEEIPLLAANKDLVTCEILPQHLTLEAPGCYEELHGYAQMNPPIRQARHRQALWQGVQQGIFDVMGTDHAPHTTEEKKQPYPNSPSGMPGVQTLVPIMLDHVAQGRLTLMRLIDLVCHGPQRVFNIAGKGRLAVGYDADFTIVDLAETRQIENDWIESRCGWTPYHGKSVTGWPKGTIIRGQRVMWEDERLGSAIGAPVKFQETIKTSEG